MHEQELRVYRDQAMRLLRDNSGQSREAIELLVREKLDKVCLAADPSGRALSPQQVEALYKEMVDISFLMFSLGYSMAHTLSKDVVRA